MLQKLKTLKSPHILVLLLAADLFYILLHILHKIPFTNSLIPLLKKDAFSISQDLGLSESFQYAQELWVALLLIWLVFRLRKTNFWGWAALYFYFLLDDMLSIHEWMGDYAGPWMNRIFSGTPLAGSKMDSVGEFLALATLGLVFVVIIYLTFRRSPPETRRAFVVLTWLTFALLFFGVGLDFGETFLPSEILKALARLLEDGGEMLSMSVILWYTYLLAGMDSSQPAGISSL